MTKRWKIIGSILIFITIIGTAVYALTWTGDPQEIKNNISVVQMPIDWRLVDERYTPKKYICIDGVSCPSAFQRWQSSQQLSNNVLLTLTRQLSDPQLSNCEDISSKTDSLCSITSTMNGYIYKITLENIKSGNTSEATINIVKKD